MIIKCEEQHREQLHDYLKDEHVFNIFLIADIYNYGFNKDFQDIWMDIEAGECVAVYLRFYNNLIIYSKDNKVNNVFISGLLRIHDIFVIMGKSSVLNQLDDELSITYDTSENNMCVLENGNDLIESLSTVEIASIDDVDEVYAFLNDIREFGKMYASKAMIEERIRNKEGKHLFIADENRIVSHANSTATTESAVMIGGIATAPSYRHKSYASKVVSSLARYYLDRNKVVCTFCTDDGLNFFNKLGFQQIGKWSIMKKSNR